MPDLNTLVLFLIVFPVIAALPLLAIRHDRARNMVVLVGSLAVMVGSLGFLLLPQIPSAWSGFALPGRERVSELFLGLEVLVAIYLLTVSVRHKQYAVCLLVVLQSALLLWLETTQHESLRCRHDLFADKFSVIMALIVGVIGGLIAIFSMSYMRAFHHHHPELRDRRPMFFFVVFVFLGAMFGLVFSNNLLWLYFFWEITTLCSFLLIGYRANEESITNAFRALRFNLVGGLGFAVGIAVLVRTDATIELQQLVDSKAIVPAVLLAFAGLTKSAQMPFSTWLTGAMVAPTPVSALLHSSTMVKAGVYLVLRLAPVLEDTHFGFLVALVGGITFLATSCIAITQSDAKKILAYSTIANLGLVVMCGGVGTHEAMWAGILLIIFHAIAKCLLFLTVGVVEYKLDSRNIESMAGMVVTMPRLAILLQIGMAGMFLAPFGMLISKWAVLKALVDNSPILVCFVVYGSAATLFFWVKWIGKLLEVIQPQQPNREDGIDGLAWASLLLLAVFTVGVCLFFPLIASHLIEPHVSALYGQTTHMSQGNLIIMAIMLGMLALFPLSFINYRRKVKVVEAYLGGANLDSSVEFQGSAGQTRQVHLENYYLASVFTETKLLQVSILVCGLVLALLLVGVALI